MFVVFEGIDGSGKTTLSNQVAARLQGQRLAVTHLRAGGTFASVVSEAIRELGRDARNLELCPQAEFLLYVARDLQLIEQVLRPALRDSDVVFADRFLYTAEVLGRWGRHLQAEWTAPILRTVAGGLAPDLVVLVDVDPTLARARRKSAKLAAADQRPPARKGLAGVGLQHRLRRGYLDLAAASPDRWVVVDNDGELEDLVARLTALVGEARRAGVAPAIAAFRAARDAAAAAVVRAGAAAAVSRPPRTPAEALQAFLRWVDGRIEREPRVAAHVLAGLAGPGIDDRRRALALRIPEAVLAGLVGLDDGVSWELRERLAADHPRAVARTLAAVPGDPARAARMREALETAAPADVAVSLVALDDDAAWAARDRLFDRAGGAVVASLATLGSDRAWALRDRWLQEWRARLPTQYDAALTAARAVTGVQGDRAWEVREQAYRAAPVAALASVEGLDDPKSWAWRQSHLRSAPKVVMGGLRGSRDPRAWELRRAVAADCKEALDSIADLDDAAAWELRDAYADVWPSTVVKTLGPLASTARGRALVDRQLGAYPTNVSLLRHAAAIALGARGAALFSE